MKVRLTGGVMKSGVAAALILAVARFGSAQGDQAKLPISIIATSYSQTQQSVQVTVLNESNRTVTAWQVSIIAKGPDGKRLQSRGWGESRHAHADPDQRHGTSLGSRRERPACVRPVGADLLTAEWARKTAFRCFRNWPILAA